MQCSECSDLAIVRVRVNGDAGTVVCKTHRTAIVRRMESVARKIWERRENRNLQAVLVNAMKSLEFESLPIELPASTVV
jgi:hypothetical protein